MSTWGFKGLFNRGLELPDGVAVDVSPVGRARIRYNDTTMQLEASLGGGGYVAIGSGGGSSPWVDDGAVVRLQDASDDVVIGAAVTVGTEKLRVVGDSRFDGSVFTDTVSTAPAGGGTLELTSDSGDVLVSTGGNNAAAFAVSDGAANYLAVDTTTGAESITLGNAADDPDFNFVGDGALSLGGTVSVEDGVTVTFAAEFDNGNSGAADTIDWTAGQKQRSTLTDDVTFTFTAPAGPGNFLLKLIQDGVGSHTVTWPAEVLWPSGVEPTLSTAAGAVDIITFYYDGTNYYGSAAFDFS